MLIILYWKSTARGKVSISIWWGIGGCPFFCGTLKEQNFKAESYSQISYTLITHCKNAKIEIWIF